MADSKGSLPTEILGGSFSLGPHLGSAHFLGQVKPFSNKVKPSRSLKIQENKRVFVSFSFNEKAVK